MSHAPPGTVWTPDIPTADFAIDDWCEVEVPLKTSKIARITHRRRRGQIIGVRGSLIIVAPRGKKNDSFPAEIKKLIKVWGYRPSPTPPPP